VTQTAACAGQEGDRKTAVTPAPPTAQEPAGSIRGEAPVGSALTERKTTAAALRVDVATRADARAGAGRCGAATSIGVDPHAEPDGGGPNETALAVSPRSSRYRSIAPPSQAHGVGGFLVNSLVVPEDMKDVRDSRSVQPTRDDGSLVRESMLPGEHGAPLPSTLAGGIVAPPNTESVTLSRPPREQPH
jgi:hypothetical protein